MCLATSTEFWPANPKNHCSPYLCRGHYNDEKVDMFLTREPAWIEGYVRQQQKSHTQGTRSLQEDASVRPVTSLQSSFRLNNRALDTKHTRDCTRTNEGAPGAFPSQAHQDRYERRRTVTTTHFSNEHMPAPLRPDYCWQ